MVYSFRIIDGNFLIMNQTTWVIGGGVIIVAIAALLYLSSGSGMPNIDPKAIPAAAIMADNKPTTTSEPAPATEDITRPTQTTMEQETNKVESATLHTSMGDITLKFYASDAPKTVENFLKLARSGFYDGVKFHRVIKGFMIQTGDPLSKDDTMMSRWGTGGPGYAFADEIAPASALYEKGYKHGVLAMANSGPNTNGSQFFIMAADYPLPPLYTIFGEVTSGLSVVDAIDAVPTSQDRPLTPVVIKSIETK